MTKLVWPNGSMDEPRFTSAYGPRTPIWTSRGWTRPYHVGCDWVGINRLMAIGDGLVVQSSYISWAGWQILIYLGKIDGIETWARYCHLASRSHLNVGDRVKRGELVGFEGSTGQVTGKHLHMELYRGAVDRGSGAYPGTTTDPRAFIRARLNAGDDEMTPEQEAKLNAIYDALFTTKPTSRGTRGGVLTTLRAIDDALFLKDETSYGTPGGVLATLRAVTDKLGITKAK